MKRIIQIMGLLCLCVAYAHSSDTPGARYLLTRVWFVLDRENDCITVEPIDDLAPLPPLAHEADGRRVRISVDDDNFAWYSLPMPSDEIEAIDPIALIKEIQGEQEEPEDHPRAPLRDLVKVLSEIPISTKLGGPETWRYVRDNRMIDEGEAEEIKGMMGIYLSDMQLDLLPLLARELGESRLSLDISGLGGESLDTVSKLTSLRWLYADGKGIRSAAPLAGLKNLISLNLGDNELTDVRPMSGLKELRRLRLSGNAVSNLSPLNDLPALQGLDVSGNVLRDVDSLSGATRLEWLNLAENPLGNVDGLSALRQLTALNLDGCGLADLGPVARLTRLVRLQFAHNKITSLSPLSGLADLEYISAPGNQVEDVKALGSLVKLRALDLSSNLISDLSPLENLTGLEFLNLAHNRIETIAVASKFRALQSLYLSGNDISDIGALKNCSQLMHLDLSENEIEDIGVLAGLRNLNTLYLYENKITDLSPLVKNAENGGLGEGATIWLTGNPLSREAANQQIRLLRTRYKINVLF